MTLLRRAIGRALRRARRDQGKTLRDVADSARVSIQYLSEVERGRKEASSEVLAAICAAHGWTLLDLLDEVRSDLRADALVEVAGAVPVPAHSRPVRGLPIGGLPIGGLPVGGLPVHGIVPSTGSEVGLAA